MATDKLVDFDHVTDYISREAAIDAVYGAFRVKDVDDFVDYRDISWGGFFAVEEWPFCPHCGIRMEGEA